MLLCQNPCETGRELPLLDTKFSSENPVTFEINSGSNLQALTTPLHSTVQCTHQWIATTCHSQFTSAAFAILPLCLTRARPGGTTMLIVTND